MVFVKLLRQAAVGAPVRSTCLYFRRFQKTYVSSLDCQWYMALSNNRLSIKEVTSNDKKKYQ